MPRVCVSTGLMVALSLAAVALSGVLALKGMPTLASSAAAAVAATATATDAGSPRDAAAIPEVVDADVGDAGSAPSAPALSAGLGLPTGAPRHVRFGVVLVTYEGAEGAEKSARHKADAMALATRLADEARTDFHAAVQRGDSGSSDDVGEVTRGVLEPASEAALFALPVGGVSAVVDTPRGFWIVKRLE